MLLAPPPIDDDGDRMVFSKDYTENWIADESNLMPHNIWSICLGPPAAAPSVLSLSRIYDYVGSGPLFVCPSIQ